LKKILFIFGTRPEAIKMSPLIKEVEKNKKDFNFKICITAQHREMLDQILDFFKINPDFDLDLMSPNQTLFDVTAKGLKGIENVLNDYNPDIIFVQGDTTTAFTGALAGYYKKIKVAHLEAGLRSGDKYSPYPEEVNRILAGHISLYHFAPTKKALNNLYIENIKQNVWVVGNTVIDALFMGLKIIQERNEKKYKDFFDFIDFNKKIILVTGHRRESFGKPFERICNAFKKIVDSYNDVEIIYPVHLNPNVQKPVYRILQNNKKIHLIEPLSYPYLIWLMNKSYFVLTDSGGIQEEAPSLGKPVLVMRDVTERTEGIKAGNAKLVGTDIDKIYSESKKLIENKKHYEKMSNAINPYGDGKTSQRIVEILKKL
jgi:UDP-N-acetylglucosamine 2-epimerase (non-hydrolysing)